MPLMNTLRIVFFTNFFEIGLKRPSLVARKVNNGHQIVYTVTI